MDRDPPRKRRRTVVGAGGLVAAQQLEEPADAAIRRPVGHHHDSAGATDAQQLAGRRGLVGREHRADARQHSIELAVGERQRLRVGHLPAQRQAALAGVPLPDRQQLGGEVGRHHVGAGGRGGQCGVAGACAHVEHPHPGPDARGGHHLRPEIRDQCRDAVVVARVPTSPVLSVSSSWPASIGGPGSGDEVRNPDCRRAGRPEDGGRRGGIRAVLSRRARGRGVRGAVDPDHRAQPDGRRRAVRRPPRRRSGAAAQRPGPAAAQPRACRCRRTVRRPRRPRYRLTACGQELARGLPRARAAGARAGGRSFRSTTTRTWSSGCSRG